MFDQSRIDGNPLTVDEAAGAVVDAILNKESGEIKWEESTPQEAEKIGIALHKRYCEEIAPKQNYIAVEALCDNLEITDLGIALTGTTDRVYATEDGIGIADLKTGKTAVSADGTVKTAGHAAQMAVYELLAQASLGESVTEPAKIIGLQVAKTPKGQRVGIGEVHTARELLIGEEDEPGLLEIAASIIHSGRFYGNPRSQICGAKYCPIFNSCRWRK